MRRVSYCLLIIHLSISSTALAESPKPGFAEARTMVHDLVGKIHESRRGGSRWSRVVGSLLPRRDHIGTVSILVRPKEAPAGDRSTGRSEKLFDVSLHGQSAIESLLRPTTHYLTASTTLDRNGAVVRETNPSTALDSSGMRVGLQLDAAGILGGRPMTLEQKAEVVRRLDPMFRHDNLMALAQQAVEIAKKADAPVRISASRAPNPIGLRSESTGRWEFQEYMGDVRLLDPAVLERAGDAPDAIERATKDWLITSSFDETGKLLFEE